MAEDVTRFPATNSNAIPRQRHAAQQRGTPRSGRVVPDQERIWAVSVAGSSSPTRPPRGLYRNLRYDLLTDRIFAVTLALVGSKGHVVPKVWVIAKSHLRRFWASRKDDSEAAQRDLLTWFKLAESAEWAGFGALKQTFGSADQVGNCVVFDVGNNRFD